MAKTVDIKALKAEIKAVKAELKPLTAEAKAACKAEEKVLKVLGKLEDKLAAATEEA